MVENAEEELMCDEDYAELPEVPAASRTICLGKKWT